MFVSEVYAKVFYVSFNFRMLARSGEAAVSNFMLGNLTLHRCFIFRHYVPVILQLRMSTYGSNLECSF